MLKKRSANTNYYRESHFVGVVTFFEASAFDEGEAVIGYKLHKTFHQVLVRDRSQ